MSILFEEKEGIAPVRSFIVDFDIDLELASY